jgi:hypothetical protein
MLGEQGGQDNQQAINRGRARLMLRLPSAREALRVSHARILSELFEDYELASCALHRFRQGSEEEQHILASEYQECCAAIEHEVLIAVAMPLPANLYVSQAEKLAPIKACPE